MADTIPAAKRAFLVSQVRILSAQLVEPEDVRASTRLARDEEELPDRVVQDVIDKANAAVRRHNARAFPPAALAHIAAQIDALYLSDAPAAHTNASAIAAAEGQEPRVLPDGTVQRGADLTDAAVLAALPDSWPEDDSDEAEGDGGSPEKRKTKKSRDSAGDKRRRVSALESYSSGRDYAALREKLLELDEKRTELGTQRLQLQKLKELIAPLEQPAVTVQPNLVSAAGRGRAGELETEMERMKKLIEQVGARIDELG